jgi:hypothetical protein
MTSQTTPGQTEEDNARRQERIEALNQVFTLFRVNYHNQFYAAYPDSEPLNLAKRLWLDALSEYPTKVILQGAKHAIETSEYLPTLHRMIESCQASFTSLGLPEPRAAYLEACHAPSPKQNAQWSHPAVYHAGRASDWFFLSNNPESSTWPVFNKHYQYYVAQVLAGETLALPTPVEVPLIAPTTSMSLEARKKAIADLKRKLRD